MDNNKELISGKDLFSLVEEWLSPMINNKKIRLGGNWNISNGAVGFYWDLFDSDGKIHSGYGRLRDDHWDVFNGAYDEYIQTNIRIFKDSIEFIEDSKFIDFTRDEMYSLYEFLKERIFGNNTERLPEIIKEKESSDDIKEDNNEKID